MRRVFRSFVLPVPLPVPEVFRIERIARDLNLSLVLDSNIISLRKRLAIDSDRDEHAK